MQLLIIYKSAILRRIQFIFLIPLLASLFCSCSKDSGVRTSNCENLKNAVINDSEEEIKVLVNDYIKQLNYPDYTEQNVNALAAPLSQGCAVNTHIYCYDCISTLPSMTEIEITVTAVQPNIKKEADITYNGTDHKMYCINVH